MKYTFILFLEGPDGFTTQTVNLVAKAGEEHTFEPLTCVPNDTRVVGISSNHGDILNWVEKHNPNKLPELCCNFDDAAHVTPTPTPTYDTPRGLEAPRAPYDLSIAYGSIVLGWFHDNAWPKTAQYFDVYRSTDEYNYQHIRTIYAAGEGLRVYNIIDEEFPCGENLRYRVAARNKKGTTVSPEIAEIPAHTCTPTPTPTPTHSQTPPLKNS